VSHANCLCSGTSWEKFSNVDSDFLVARGTGVSDEVMVTGVRSVGCQRQLAANTPNTAAVAKAFNIFEARVGCFISVKI